MSRRPAAWRIVLLVLVAAAASRARAVPSCARGCDQRMGACRAERCAGLTRKACRDRCRAVTGCRAGGARIGTVASVVTTCRVDGGVLTGEQRLEIKRGDCPPTKVVEFVASSPVPEIGLCELYGEFRDGGVATTVAPLQRLGISPDGRTILFEVNPHTKSLPGPAFEVQEADEGIFAVRADGSGLRRLGPPSRERPYKGPAAPYPFPPGFNIAGGDGFKFSPDGRFVVFSDRGLGSDGTEAGQLVVMDVLSGTRTQVTALSGATESPPLGFDLWGDFVDDETISGKSIRLTADNLSYPVDPFLVRRDGTEFRYFVQPSPIPGAQVVENFEVTRREGNVITLTMPSAATDPNPGPAQEVWTRDDARMLQLTNLGRSDTYGGALSRDGERVFFAASTNQLGTNPMNNCQLFSVPRLGGPLRQLTRFDPPIPSTDGCNRNAPSPACRVINFQTDARGSLLFIWTCDPFGLGSNSSQAFAMRADGSGLRQVTNYAGTREGPDGSFSVELPGPTVFSAYDKAR